MWLTGCHIIQWYKNIYMYMIDEVFRLISRLRDIEKCKLIVDKGDEFCMKEYYKNIKGIISYKLWRKIVIDYSIDTQEDILDTCDILVDEILKKYKR